MPIDREAIIAAWLAGSSAGRIAIKFDVTRNTVAGIVHRWKAERRAAGLPLPPARSSVAYKPRGPKLEPVKRRTPPPKVKPTPEPKPVKEPSGPGLWVPLLETGDKTCRMSRDGVLFCNAPTDDGPYCSFHRQGLNMAPKPRVA